MNLHEVDPIVRIEIARQVVANVVPRFGEPGHIVRRQRVLLWRDDEPVVRAVRDIVQGEVELRPALVLVPHALIVVVSGGLSGQLFPVQAGRAFEGPPDLLFDQNQLRPVLH